jgi:hypothetical protein
MQRHRSRRVSEAVEDRSLSASGTSPRPSTPMQLPPSPRASGAVEDCAHRPPAGHHRDHPPGCDDAFTSRLPWPSTICMTGRLGDILLGSIRAAATTPSLRSFAVSEDMLTGYVRASSVPSTQLQRPVHLARPGGHGRRAHHRPPGLPDHPRPFTRAVHRASSPRPRFDPRSVLREHREVRDPESKTEGKIKKVCQLVSK